MDFFKAFKKFKVGELAVVTRGRVINYATKDLRESPTLEPGDVVLFLESIDEQQILVEAITSHGVVYFDKAYTLWMQNA